MKKQFFVCLFAALTLGSVVTSCSDDDEPIVCPIETTTFNSSNGLELTYSGASLLGKQVVFTPNAEDATKATLVLSGNNFAVEGMPIEIPGAGVIPGETTTTLNIENMIINGDAVSFEGKDENDGRTISYKGSANKSGMKLELNVTMTANALTGKTFNLTPYEYGVSTPLVLDWVSDSTFPFLGSPWDIHSLLTMVQVTPLIPIDEKTKVTLAEALLSVFNSVTFLPDGNIQAAYKDAPKDEAWKTSPINLATYIIDANNQIRLFINPEQIAALQAAASRAGLQDLIPSVLQIVNKYMIEGIPVTYELKDGKFVATLGKDVLLPLLQIAKPLFQDKEFVKTLMDMISKSAGEMGPLVAVILPPILESMPEIIDKTTEIYAGVDFVVAE